LKPENILIDPSTLTVKICDFGSAKKMGKGLNTPYIVSRYYRAPELIFCNKKYDESIDIWSAGCIFAELFNGMPVFTGNTESFQFIKQVQVLGPPSPDELLELVQGLKFEPAAIINVFSIKKKADFSEIFKGFQHSDVACEFALEMLRFAPSKRLTASQCLSHRIFQLA
jgi:glycogen synthase kinase 3 beta